LWLLRDVMSDAGGKPTHMFWDAASYVGNQLPAAVTANPADPRYFMHAVTKQYKLVNLQPDQVTMRVRIQPVGLDVLDDLIASGDLDPSVRPKMVTFDLSTTMLTWQRKNGYGCVP